MNKLTVVVPVHELANDKDKNYLDEALRSLAEQSDKQFDVILYLHKDVKYKVPSGLNLNLKRVKRDEKFSYTQAVNDAVKTEVQTDYFSVLEMDDKMHPYYIKQFHAHLNFYEDEYDLYMGLLAEVNAENQFMGLRNESAWIVNNMNEIGVLDLETCKDKFQSLSLTGAIFNKESFLEIGGLKEKFPIFFNFEYILRALHNSHEIYVIPKVMVNHTNGREGSYFDQCANDYQLYERTEYLNFVKKEYVFEEDREIKVAENNLKIVK